MEKKKVLKFFRTAASVLWWVMLILVAFVTASVLTAKIRGEVPRLFGYSVMHIVSGSMEPEIPEGTYILVKKVDPEDVKKNQIITFYSDDPDIYGFPNTHRVVEEPFVGDEGLEFITRGDAGTQNDDFTAKADRLIGVHVKNLTFLTGFSEFLSGGAMYFIIMVMLLGICVMTVWGILREKNGDASDKTEKDIADEAVREYIAREAVRKYIEQQRTQEVSADKGDGADASETEK